LDDVIVSGGENVSLPSVAATVRGFDGVAYAVAVGVTDAEWGSVVGVMVEGTADLAELAAAATEALAPHERPKRWLVVASLPVLDTGKPDLVAIRRAMNSGSASL
jgi:O-succinylbenzoic acid--CoA ligase